MFKFIKNYFKYKHLNILRRRLQEVIEEKQNNFKKGEVAITNLKDHNKEHVKCIAKYEEQAGFFAIEYKMNHELEKMLKSIIKEIDAK